MTLGHSDLVLPVEVKHTGRDWLDCRIPLPFGDAVHQLLCALPKSATVKEWKPMSRLGYQKGIEVVGPPNTGTLRLLGDHKQSLGWSMYSASQGCADWLFELLDGYKCADFVPQVNRVDVAVDFICEQEVFDALYRNADETTQNLGKPTWYDGKPATGRTLYMNWEKKPEHKRSKNESIPMYTGRLYEKGKQMDGNEDWRRIEIAYRPDKVQFKERAFRLPLNDVLGSTAWAQAVLAMIGYSVWKPERNAPVKAEPLSLAAERSRRMQTLAHMGDQYGRAARELAELVGKDRVTSMVLDALFNPGDADKGILSGSDALRRGAQREWDSMFSNMYRKGATGMHLPDREPDDDEDTN